MSEDKVIEDRLYAAGISPLAGVDEAGRGACAGPLVVASVILKDPRADELEKNSVRKRAKSYSMLSHKPRYQ